MTTFDYANNSDLAHDIDGEDGTTTIDILTSHLDGLVQRLIEANHLIDATAVATASDLINGLVDVMATLDLIDPDNAEVTIDDHTRS